jgi:capsular polysaccharide biosynthesis protein
MPTKLASEAVMSREALVAIIQQTGLLKEWDARRPFLMRAKGRVMDMVRRPLTNEEKTDALVEMLKQHMWVNSDEGTVTIGAAWPDPEMAYRIVQAAQQNFLEERHASEVSIIGESIAILESHATEVRATIDSTIEEVRRARSTRPVKNSTPQLAPTPAKKVDEEAAGLQAMLTAKRQAIADLEEFRNKRMAELQTRLAEQKSTYGAAHPAIESTQQAIAALAVESPQLTALRREERTLVAQLARKGIQPDIVAPSKPLEPLVLPVVHSDADTADARESYAQSRLRLAVAAYGDLLDRLDGARIELETARAAFKYRYRVLDPVKLPKKPAKPNVPVFLGGGLMLAVLLGVAAAVVSDLAGRLVLEAWQVERQLGLPVLAVVEDR